jgi:hypothetical protein
LATILSNRTALTTGAIAWYEVALRAPEAQHVRIRIGLRPDDLKSEIRAHVAGPAQAAVAARMGTLNWINFRFSNFRATVDSVVIGPSGAPNSLNIVVGGTVNAAREQYVWHWEGIHSGMHWEGRGDKDVATYHANFALVARPVPAPQLSSQSIVFDSVPTSNSVTMNLNPVRGMTMSNAFSVPQPAPQTFSLAQAATQVPDSLKGAQVRYVHVLSISDAEIVVEADVY